MIPSSPHRMGPYASGQSQDRASVFCCYGQYFANPQANRVRRQESALRRQGEFPRAALQMNSEILAALSSRTVVRRLVSSGRSAKGAPAPGSPQEDVCVEKQPVRSIQEILPFPALSTVFPNPPWPNFLAPTPLQNQVRAWNSAILGQAAPWVCLPWQSQQLLRRGPSQSTSIGESWPREYSLPCRQV